MPDVTASYFYPKAQTSVSVVQTVGCNAERTKLISAVTVLPSTTYVSDYDQAPGKVEFAKFGGQLKDADVTLNFTDDHRLSGVNSTTTGEAAAVVKSAASLATAVVAAVVAPEDLRKELGKPVIPVSPVKAACNQIATMSGAKANTVATVSITYAGNLVYAYASHHVAAVAPDPALVGTSRPPKVKTAPPPGAQPGAPAVTLVTLEPDAASKPIFDSLPILAPTQPAVWVSGVVGLPEPLTWNTPTPDGSPPAHFYAVTLNRVDRVTLAVSGPSADLTGPPTVIWQGETPVPALEHYPVLVPSGTPFGNQKFALTLNGAGQVTQVEYGANTGAADAFNAAQSAAAALPAKQSQTDKDNAKADAIEAHERLITCTTTSSCPGK